MLFMIVFPQIYLTGSILVITSVTCLGSSWVVLNSFLPLLVANDPSIQVARSGRTRDSSDIALETLSSNATVPNSADYNQQHIRAAAGHLLSGTTSQLDDFKSIPVSPELQLSTRISSRGVGIGYCAAIFVQCLSILILYLLSKTSISSSSASLPLRIILFLVGLWWFTFTMVSRLWLRNRPGPPLTSRMSRYGSKWSSWLALIRFAWISLWRTIKVAAKLRQAVIFLVAWFLLSDAIATVSATAILFAKTELQMANTAMALMSIASTTSGMTGAFTWPIISRRLRMKSNHTIIACIALFEIIPLYGLLGYVPFIKNWGVIGLQQAWEIYPLALVHGFVLGGLSSYCRSFFGLLIPPGSEAAFYALYAVTDKGSSVFGPALVGIMVDVTGQIRSAFVFLAVLILLPIPLIWLADADRGRRDALEMAEAVKGSKVDDEDAIISRPQRLEEREGLLEDDE
jgi:MFS transporter, UMF1 family